MEDERVFEDSHGLILEWVREGVLDGLRVDHPDGLRDPAGYFRTAPQGAPRTAGSSSRRSSSRARRLPDDWPVAGTTGYDFLNRLGGLFVDPAGEGPITDFYAALHRRAGRLRRDGPRQEALRPQGALRQRRQPAGRAPLGGLRAAEALSRLHPPRADDDDPRGHRLLPRLSDLRPGRARGRSASATSATSTRRSTRPRRTGPRSTPSCSTSSATCSCSSVTGRSSRSWSCGSSRTPGR